MSNIEKNAVILIEDDEDYAKLFRSKLETWDAAYTVMTNPTFGPVRDEDLETFVSQVLAVVAKHRDDCAAVFLDLGLGLPDEENPMLKGLHVGKAIRDKFYEIPILILTRFGKKNHVAEAYLYDFDAYIEKRDLATWKSEQFHGYLLRSMRKRQAMVRNLARYYAQHAKRFPDAPSVSVVSAFGTAFCFEGSSLERTLDSASAMKTYFNAQHRYTVILFADLVGSSEIKTSLGFFEGLRIAREHNMVVTEEIEQAGGLVVKYIGDCTMARFDYPTEGDVDCASVNAAIRIQERFAEINHTEEHGRPLESKIGIGSGKVADFYGNDPQGAAVDLAARIQAKAKANQIMVLKELIDLCKSADLKSRIGEAKCFRTKNYISTRHQFMAKGFKDPVEVYEINWDGTLRGISE